MSDPITIKKLIERISSGDIRIPAFQRDFVWEPDQVAFLLDSIYKEFPIGTVILWKTDVRLVTEKRLGFFDLPEPEKDYPVNYVLDGQQRLTSLFSVFQSDLKPQSDQWVDIYFDMYASDSAQDSAFLALDDAEVDLGRHFPVNTFFETVAYRKATEKLSSELIVKMDEVQDRFKSYLVPNEVFETDDRNKVAIVFERINRAGTPLDVFELLAAWSWSDQFDLVEQFNNLQDDIAEHGFSELCDDRDLQLRICAGIITGQTTPQSILDLQGEEIRSRFVEIRNGILGALDFLKREANVKHYKMIPFPGLLVPLSCFFATDRTDGVKYTSRQKDQILQWFWRSVFGRRFAAAVSERQAADISQMLKLRGDKSYEFRLPSSDIKFEFDKTNFTSNSANSKTLILLLNSCSPQSLISGAKVDVDNVLKKGSKHEYHHVFPKKHLEDLGVDRAQVNVLANICFLTRGDNNHIKDKAPSVYGTEIEPSKREQYLYSALLPPDFDSLSYEEFLSKRSSLLLRRATELMG